MKKIYRFALILIALMACAVFSACGNKYSKLSMKFMLDGENLDYVRLVYDEEGDKASQRIAVKVSGIKQKDIGQLSVYSSPIERVDVVDYRYENDLCYVTINANVVGSGELVVTHLTSDKSYSIPLDVVQKASSLTVKNENYVVNVPTSGINSHQFDISQMVKLNPTNSSDSVYFTLARGNFIPSGVSTLYTTVGDKYYITGLKVEADAENSVLSLNPVTILDGYDAVVHTNKVVNIHIARMLDSSNLAISATANSLLDKTETNWYDLNKTIYLVANDKNAINYKETAVGNYNNVKLSLHYKKQNNGAEELLDIAGLLNYYDIVLPETSEALNVSMVDDNKVLITAIANTNGKVDVDIVFKPKAHFVGQIYTVEKSVAVEGVVKADTIKVVKNRTTLEKVESYTAKDAYFDKVLNAYYETDIFDYYSFGNPNGAMFGFTAESQIPVFQDLRNLKIAVAPEALYANNNLFDNDKFEGKASSDLYGVNVSDQKYVLRISKSGDLLKFHYDEELKLMVSEVFSSVDNVYIKYETNEAITSEELVDFGVYVITANNSVVNGNVYLKDIESTIARVTFNKNDSVKSMTVNAGYYQKNAGNNDFVIYPYSTTIDATKVYLNREEGVDNTGIDPKLLMLGDDALEGYNKKLTSATFEVKATPLFENCENPLKVVTISSTFSNDDAKTELTFDFDSASVHNEIGLVFNANTDIGKYHIVFTQHDDVGNKLFEKVIEVSVFENITLEDISIEIEENDHIINNTDAEFASYNADYIVGTGEKFNINVMIPEASKTILAGYNFGYGKEDTEVNKLYDASGNALENTASEYLTVADNVDPLINFAELTAIKGSYVGQNAYVVLRIGVESLSFDNIITPSAENKTTYYHVKFFVYEKIKETDVAINVTTSSNTSTVSMDGVLGAYFRDESKATLSINMNSELLQYVQPYTQADNYQIGQTGKAVKVVWIADDGSFITTNDQTDTSISLTFGQAGTIRQQYTKRITAILYQFNTPITFDANIYVERPKVTTKLQLNSQLSPSGSIDLKLNDEPYKVEVTKWSNKDYATHDGIRMQVVDSTGTDVVGLVTIDQENQTLKLTKDPTGYDKLKLIIFAKDALNQVITSGLSGYITPSNFLKDGSKGAYLSIDLNLISGESVETAFKIYNEDDFWAINNNKDSYFELMNNITLTKTGVIDNFSGVLFSNGEQYTIYGVTLNNTNRNLFTNLSGDIYNVCFDVEFDLSLGQLSQTINLGVIDEISGDSELVNVSVLASGNVSINTTSLVGAGVAYVGALAGTNNGTIAYNSSTDPVNNILMPKFEVFGVDGELTLQGKDKVYFGGLVGYNKGEIVGYANPVADLVSNTSLLSSDQVALTTSAGTEGKITDLHIKATTLTNELSAVGGVVGLNQGSITNGWASGKIEGLYNIGGVIGENKLETISTINVAVSANNGITQGITSVGRDFAYNLQDIKSSAVIFGDTNVGGIVGVDTNGLFNHCYYQVVKTNGKYNSITGVTNVGGIAGNSTCGIFNNCSVMSYRLDYANITNILNTQEADIIGKNYVGGIVGLSSSETDAINEDIASTLTTKQVAVLYSSVNAFIKQQNLTWANVGAILCNNTDKTGTALIFNSYFFGKLEGDLNSVHYTSLFEDKEDRESCLDNNGTSATNQVYSINVVKSEIDGQATVKVGRKDLTQEGSQFIINGTSVLPYWQVDSALNGEYPFVTIDQNGANPIFEVAPTEIKVSAKKNIVKEDSIYLEYYNFNDMSVGTQIVNNLNNKYNSNNIFEYLQFECFPATNYLILNVATNNPLIAEVSREGNIIVNGVGTCVLTFRSVINPSVYDTVTINVVAPKGELVLGNTFDAKTSVDAIAITKDASKLLYLNSTGVVTGEDYDPYTSNETYYYETSDKINLKVEIEFALGASPTINDVSKYIEVNGKTLIHQGEGVYSVDVLSGELFSLKLKKYEQDLTFTMNVTPYIKIEDKVIEFSKFNPVEISLTEGATNIHLSQDFAYIYPNDEVYLTAYISTDVDLNALANGNTVDYIDSLLTITDVSEVGTLCIVEVGDWNEDAHIQPVVYKFKVNENVMFNKDDAVELEVYFTISNGNGAKIDYTILPQRINSIEIKNYVQTQNTQLAYELKQTDVLLPATTTSSNGGIIAIDIAPINGYYDYLEIKDITGNEEIKFSHVTKVLNADGSIKTWQAVNNVDISTADGKGIVLKKLDGATTVYVLTQIDKDYTTKPHTVQVTAHLNRQAGVEIPVSTKIIEVRMLPIITVEYILPDGSSSELSRDSSQSTAPLDIKLANGTSATLRITAKNVTSEITSSVDSYYKLTHDYGDYYTFELNDAYDSSQVGKTITLSLKASYLGDGNYEETDATVKFNLMNFVVHGVSLTNANNSTISGNIDTLTDLEFYFDEKDISYYEEFDNSFHINRYEYDPNLQATEGSARYIINEILKELNTNSNYFAKSQSDENVQLITEENMWKLTVSNGYNPETKLQLKYMLTEDGNNWKLDLEPDENKFKNYSLNFTMVSSRIKPKVIKSEQDFLSMASGEENYYILGNDLVLDEYVPIDVNVAEFDGNGRTITINSFDEFESTTIKAGLFAQIYDGMIVKNLVVNYKLVDGASPVDLCYNATGTVNYSSAEFGGLTPVNNGVITNCIVKGEINLKVSTIANKKNQVSGELYSIAFNVGGFVATNSTTGYITHSTSKLKIITQANIGGFVYKNSGKIVSCLVEEAEIKAYPQGYDKTIVTNVAGFAVENLSGTSNSFTGKSTGEISMCGVEYMTTTLSAKDASAGFVYKNSARIYDCYVEMSELGSTSNTFSGFANQNSGTIATSYSYVNKGVFGNNINMFAPGGTLGLENCIEVVSFGTNYNNFIESGLSTVSLANRHNRTTFESLHFAFGDNSSAVWTLQTGRLPRLVSVEDNLQELTYSSSDEDADVFYGLRKVYKVASSDPEFDDEYQVNDGTYGTEKNPYIIANLEDWNYYFTTGTTKYYRIVSDIDFSSYTKNPKTSTMTFKGNIQGNNMCLSGIMLYSEDELSSLGLFKALESANDLSVKNAARNLTLRTSSVWATKTQAVGMLAGIADGFNLYNLTADKNNEIIIGGNAVGGIVGLVRGKLDAQKLVSNVGVNSTRATEEISYSIYKSYNNERSLSSVSENLSKVYYAGSVFGIIDGYDRTTYRIDRERDISTNFFIVRDVYVSGNITVVGDTVGLAFGFVGERVLVDDVRVAVSLSSIAGKQYSAGAVGENRGVITNANVSITNNDAFTRSTNVSAGLVGLNMGGMVTNSAVKVNIDKLYTSSTTVAGVVGRNINGNVNNCAYSGMLGGYYVGGIIGADYSDDTILEWGSTGAFSIDCRNNNIVPKNEIVYKNKGTTITNYANNKLSKQTIESFLSNIRLYYTFSAQATFEESANAYYVYGLFVGLTDDDTHKFVNKVGVQGDWLVFNGTVGANAENVSITTSVEDGNLIPPIAGDTNLVVIPSANVINAFVPESMNNYYLVTFVVGARVGGFNAWDLKYSNEILVFTNNELPETP